MKGDQPPARLLSVFLVSSTLIILYSLPDFGSSANISSFFVFGPVSVSTSRILAGPFLSGQLNVKFQVIVLPSLEASPVPVMMPVLWLSSHVETYSFETLS